MIPVEEAIARVRAGLEPVESETVPLAAALERVTAAAIAARVAHPPQDMSAMDGYAVRATDIASPPVELGVIGEAPAGAAYAGVVGPGQAVRIFTGGPVPAGADTVVIQEDTEAVPARHRVRILQSPERGRYIRPAGMDFMAGETVIAAGRRITARTLALLAAMNIAEVPVRRRPRIALLSLGSELVEVGAQPGPYSVINSNSHGLAAFFRAEGAEVTDLGIAPDDAAATGDRLEQLKDAGADLLVTTGGASVGDHDLIRDVLGDRGFETAFWKVAMRPGKPSFFGRLRGPGFGNLPVLGLPGNPVSALVSAVLYGRPFLAARLGRAEAVNRPVAARLTTALAANDSRQDYLRAAVELDETGMYRASPFPRQDSAMILPLERADGLIVRPPHAPARAAGETVPVILL